MTESSGNKSNFKFEEKILHHNAIQNIKNGIFFKSTINVSEANETWKIKLSDTHHIVY